MRTGDRRLGSRQREQEAHTDVERASWLIGTEAIAASPSVSLLKYTIDVKLLPSNAAVEPLKVSSDEHKSKRDDSNCNADEVAIGTNSKRPRAATSFLASMRVASSCGSVRST